MAWDRGEDHLIVSYSNGLMGMVDFNGFENDQTIWKIQFERQSVGVN
jgi:hypothetical protein